MRGRFSGFTLIEAVAVIAITGIISAVVAVFMRAPITAYFDQARRAQLVDTADTALRRVARELRLAVPNTVRTAGGGLYVEFLLVTAGGRYRFDSVDEACFISGCSSLTTLGSVIANNNDYVGSNLVVYNQYNNAAGDCSATNPSVYCGHNLAPIISTNDGGLTDTIGFASNTFVPQNGSDSRRFLIFSGPVTFSCESGELRRYSGYALNAVQNTAGLGTPAVLATDVDCDKTKTSFVYTTGVYETWGVVGMTLTLTRDGETVTLYHEVHIDNAP